MLIRMWLPLGVLGLLLADPAWSDCQAIYQRAKDADLATLETLYQEARNTPDCDDAFRARLGQRASNEYLRQIQARLRQDPGADVAESLDRALSYARSWQGLAMRGDLRHEPSAALASGRDGLDAIRRIVADAPAFLECGGRILLEHGYDQAPTVRNLLVAAGLTDIEQHRDLTGIPRVSGARRL